MTKNEFLILLTKYLDGEATQEEVDFLEAYYQFYNADTEVQAMLDNNDDIKQSIKSGIEKQIQRHTRIRKINIWPRIAAAAAIILITAGSFLFFHSKKQSKQLVYSFKPVPGSNKAILTLANGQKISLSDAKNGLINQQAGIKVYKSKNGQLVYTASSSNHNSITGINNSPEIWNTITTPRGGQWQVILPDGTKVWINSASTLKYPERFTGTIRKVVLQGEAYFEVFHNKQMPFHVASDDQDVEVLGTHFNINSYSDESFSKTTLLEGAVKITQVSSKRMAYLKPDQQATLFPGKVKIADVDSEDAIAWKEGFFSFNEDNLNEIMRKISRWYNVDVEFKDESIKNEMFSGTVSRFAQISDVLGKLEALGGVSFHMESNKVIVVKK